MSAPSKAEPASGKPSEAPAPKPLIPLLELYRYRDGIDTFLITLSFIGALAGGAGIPAFSELWGRMMDDMTVTTSMKDVGEHVARWAELLTYVGIGMFVVSFLEVGCMMYSVERQMKRIRAHYIKAALEQEIGYYDQHTPGEIGARLAGDTKVMQQGMGEKVSQTIKLGSTFIAGLTFGFIKSWRLTLVILSVFPLIATCGAVMGKMITSLSKVSQDSYSAAGSLATQSFENIRTVHSFNAITFEYGRFSKFLAEARSHGVKKSFWVGGTSGVVLFILFGSYALAFWYSSTLVRDGYHTVGDIISCFFAVVIASFSIGSVASPAADIAAARGAAYGVFETINLVPKINLLKKGKTIPNLEGRITFRNVTFAYPTRTEQVLLRKFDLDLNAGQSAAFVGPSGCGKSSLVALILRFYDPLEGEILVDGIPLKDLDVTWWRDQCAVVSQEPTLFSGSILDNVKAGNPNITDADVIQACKDAFIHEVIAKLPNTYQTEVGSLGSQLSGGQKQRIAIARALVKKPKILLLDEATSALDRRSEVKVQRAIDRILTGKHTTIVIAHRLVTIKDCGVIHVLEPQKAVSNEPIADDKVEAPVNTGSRITESGSFMDLIEKNGTFTALYKAQGKHGGAIMGSAPSPINPTTTTFDDDTQRQQQTAGSSSHPEDDDDLNVGTVPEKEKKGSEEAPIPLGRIISLSRPEFWAIGVGTVGALLGGAVYPFYAVVLSEMLNVLGKKQGKDLDEDGPFWAMLFLVIGGGALISNFLQFGFFGYAGEKLTERLRLMLMKALLHNEIAFFDEPGHEPGALGAVLAGDTEAIHALFGPEVSVKVAAFSTLACAFGISFYYSWKVALVCLSVVPAVAIAGTINMLMMKGFGDRNSDALEAAGKIAHEATANIRTVAAYNMHADVNNRYGKTIEERERSGKTVALSSGVMFGFGQFAVYSAFALAFWYGGKLISDGEETFRSVMISSMALVMGASGMGKSSAFTAQYKDAQGSAKKVFGYIDRMPSMDVAGNQGGDFLSNKADVGITFDDVTFTYPTRPNTTVLKHIDLDIPPRQHIAVIGSTGCGKSTLMQLMLRYYDPARSQDAASSRVMINYNHDLKDVGVAQWRSHVAAVSQEPSLFEGTIAENISYGLKDVTKEEIVEAATLANLKDDIEGFPDKYDTQVGTRGSKLSGGQKQRVAIARAILRKPQVLLLDEATSALDNKSEALVQKALETVVKGGKGMTIVTIAHRLSTIEGADQIVVLDDGVVVEKGSHEELMALKGQYHDRYLQYYAAGK